MLQCTVKYVMILEDFRPEVRNPRYQSLALLVQRLESLVRFTFCMMELVRLGVSNLISLTLHNVHSLEFYDWL